MVYHEKALLFVSGFISIGTQILLSIKKKQFHFEKPTIFTIGSRQFF